jgi:hypothetical protein
MPITQVLFFDTRYLDLKNYTWYVPRGYKGAEKVLRVVQSEESNVGTPGCRDMSSGAEELNWVESSELAAAE